MNNQDIGGIAELTHLFEFKKMFIFLLGVFIIYVFNKILARSAEKLSKHLPSRRLLVLQIVTIFIFLIYIIGVALLFYQALKPSQELILALGGSAAVALGLALKDLVSSLVSGLILLFDQPFQVGDRVTFDDEYGEIISIGLRTVRMKTLDDNIVTIPNSRFLTDVVSSGNSGSMDMMVVNDFYIDIDNDVKKVEKIIRESIASSPYSFLKKPISIIFKEILENGSLILKVSAKSYVLDVKYEKRFESEVTCKVQELFAKNKIKRPSLKVATFSKIAD